MHYVDPKIKGVFRLHQPEGRKEYLRLDQNENPDGLPHWLFDEVMKDISPETLAMYPEDTRLAEKYAWLLGLEPGCAVMTDGSVVGMGYVIKVFGEPGKKLLCVTPSFGMYKAYADMQGMETILVSYEKDYSLDINKILDAIDGDTSIVCLVNPNMPLGNAYAEGEIERVVEKADRNDALVIVDEAYYYFHDKSAVELVKKYDNVVILRTFSKMLSIPGLRLGAIISCKENIKYVNNYIPHYTVNNIALKFGEAIVDNHDRLVSELKEKFDAGKAYMMEALDRSGYKYLPTSGCYVCIYPKHKSAEAITAELEKNGILILCGKGDAAGFLRVTIWDKKYMKIFVSALLDVDR